MSLRRTALQRRTPLARTSMPARTRELKGRAPKRAAARRDTGPTQATRRLVLDRAEGCCEVCGRHLHDGTAWLDEVAHSLHHRRARGMGGDTRPDVNSPANLLLVCGSGTSLCHGWIESNRTLALVLGYLVSQEGRPDLVAVELTNGRHVTLTHDGTYQDAA